MDGKKERLGSGELTKREWEVLIEVAAGWGNQAIAANLTLSQKTVEMHLSNIYQKLGVKNRVQAALWHLSKQQKATNS